VRLEPHTQRKDAANENAPIIDPVWTKERWNQIQRRPDTRDDAAEQDASFNDHPWTRLRWSRVRGHPYRGKVAARTVRRLKSLSVQESAELEPEVVRKETYSEILRRCLSCVLYHTVQFILRFMSHCPANYGPKVEQPNVLFNTNVFESEPMRGREHD